MTEPGTIKTDTDTATRGAGGTKKETPAFCIPCSRQGRTRQVSMSDTCPIHPRGTEDEFTHVDSDEDPPPTEH